MKRSFFTLLNIMLLSILSTVFSADLNDFVIGAFEVDPVHYAGVHDVGDNFIIGRFSGFLPDLSDPGLTNSGYLNNLENYGLKALVSKWHSPGNDDQSITWLLDCSFACDWTNDSSVDAYGGYAGIFNPNGFTATAPYEDHFDYTFSHDVGSSVNKGYSKYSLMTTAWEIPAHISGKALYNLTMTDPRNYFATYPYWHSGTADISVTRKVYLRISDADSQFLGRLKIYHLPYSGGKIEKLSWPVGDSNPSTTFHNVACGTLNISSFHIGDTPATTDKIEIEYTTYDIDNPQTIHSVILEDDFTGTNHFDNFYDGGPTEDIINSLFSDLISGDNGNQTIYGFYADELTPGGLAGAKLFNQLYSYAQAGWGPYHDWYKYLGVNSSLSYGGGYNDNVNMLANLNAITGMDATTYNVNNDPISAWGHLYLTNDDPNTPAGITAFISKAIEHWRATRIATYIQDKPFWATVSDFTYDWSYSGLPTHLARAVNAQEIKLQANIAISQGAKGIWYYPYYWARNDGGSYRYIGIVDHNNSHSSSPYSDNWNAVQYENERINAWNKDLMNAHFDTTWRSNATVPTNCLINSIASYSGDLQISTFTSLATEASNTPGSVVKYLFVVNRNTTNNANITFNLKPGVNSTTGILSVVDCYTKERVAGIYYPNGVPTSTLSTGTILPGEAVLLRITDVYLPTKGYSTASNEHWTYDKAISQDIKFYLLATLSIDPGVQLYFSNGGGTDYGRTTKTELVFDEGGLSADHVGFYGWDCAETDKGVWGGIYVLAPVNISITNCHIYNGYYPVWLQTSYTATIYFIWNTIFHASGTGLVIKGANCNPSVANNHISDIDNLGVSIIYNATPDLTNNIINSPNRACIYTNIDPQARCYGNDLTSGYTEYVYNVGGNSTYYGFSSGVPKGQLIRNTNANAGTIFRINGGNVNLAIAGNSQSGYNAFDVAQGDGGYAVINGTSYTIPAQHNWWGTTSNLSQYFSGSVDYTNPLQSYPWTQKSESGEINLPELSDSQKLEAEEKYKEAYDLRKSIIDTSKSVQEKISNLHGMKRDAWLGLIYDKYEKDLKGYLLAKDDEFVYRAKIQLAKVYIETDRFKDGENLLTSFEKGTFKDREALLHLLDYYFIFNMKEKAIFLEQTLKEHFPKDENLDIAFKYSEELPIYVSAEDLKYKEGLGKIGSESKIESKDANFSVYPNPFNATAKIRFAVKESGQVQMAIYNTLGQKVRTLISRRMEQGNHEVLWNGFDDFGNQVSTGLYFVSLTANNKRQIAKMVFAK